MGVLKKGNTGLLVSP